MESPDQSIIQPTAQHEVVDDKEGEGLAIQTIISEVSEGLWYNEEEYNDLWGGAD